jgi:aminopeptidase
MDAAALKRYADAIVRDALRLGDGDLLAIEGDPEHRELLVALAEAGYRAGCRYCDVLTIEPRVTRLRALHGPLDSLGEQPGWRDRWARDLLAVDAGFALVIGPEEPDLMADVPPERAAALRPESMRLLRAVTAGKARFCVAGYPTPRWASRVYPELPAAEALVALERDLLDFARIGPDDAPDGWARHVARLGELAAELTARGLRELTLRGPGTDLRVGLPEGAIWMGGTIDGRTVRFSPNIPTEEVFTAPSPRTSEGTFACTHPLELGGRVIDGIRAELRRGQLVRIEADRPDDVEFLTGYLSRDRGAGRLGELALVDAQSRVGMRGRSYGTTLLEENAASHVAFGAGYRFNRALGAERVNSSQIHVDVMIGRPELEVHGRDARGSSLAVLVDGELLPGR